MISPHGVRRATAVVTVMTTLVGLCLAGCAPRKPITDASRAAASDPLRGIDLYAAGAQAYRRGDKEAALKQLSEAVSQNPNLRMAQAMLGDLYRSKGDYEHAA